MLELNRFSGRIALVGFLSTAGLSAAVRGSEIADWTLDGTTADSVGGRTLTLHGTTSYSTNTPTGSGQSLQVSNPGWASYAPSVSDTVSGAYTVDLYVNIGASGGGTFFGTRSGGDESFDEKLQSSNSLHGDIGDGSNWITTGADGTFSPPGYKANTWYNIAYSVTTTGYTIYVNGANFASNTYSSTTPLLWNSTHIIGIGAVGGGGGENFTGLISNVQVFNTALSQSQVQALLVPEPSTLGLASIAITALAARRRRTA